MITKKQTLHHWFFSISILILLAGLLAATMVFQQSNISRYPSLIANAYQDPRHRLIVPGDMEVKLTRTGAYGLYFEHDLTRSYYPEIKIPPAIDCTLTSKSTKTVIQAVPDYVKTNRYTTRGLYSGVLIMSITVEKPGNYTFSCDYKDGREEPELRVALGPNYFWEFLRVIWEISFPLFGSSCILCGSVTLSLLLFFSGIAIKVLNRGKSKTQH